MVDQSDGKISRIFDIIYHLLTLRHPGRVKGTVSHRSASDVVPLNGGIFLESYKAVLLLRVVKLAMLKCFLINQHCRIALRIARKLIRQSSVSPDVIFYVVYGLLCYSNVEWTADELC